MKIIFFQYRDTDRKLCHMGQMQPAWTFNMVCTRIFIT